MVALVYLSLLFLVALLSSLLLAGGREARTNPAIRKLPPGPTKLPIIGNLHQIRGNLLHQSVWEISKQYGPLMHLKLGQVSAVVVSSASLAKDVLKTFDLACCSRPHNVATSEISYGRSDIAFMPYGESWRQLRKLCTVEFFSARKIHSFASAREEEITRMAKHISSRIADSLRSRHRRRRPQRLRLAQGRAGDDGLLLHGRLLFPARNIFIGGTNSSSAVVEWAMVELIRRPELIKRAQEEVRSCVGRSKGKVEESDLHQLHYLKLIVKETMRLHPPVPMLIHRETMHPVTFSDGYHIPPNTTIYVNAWAIRRDPDAWERPEDPERFVNMASPAVDSFAHYDFKLILFGEGRRICPERNMLELALSVNSD